MKANKAIRLLKTVDPLAVRFRSDGAPYIVSSAGYNQGWEAKVQSHPGAYLSLDVFQAEWNDTIDIAGLAANDISLINAGGAVARCNSPTYDSQQAATCQQITIVSVNPIEVDYLKFFTANALSSEGNLQDYFLATCQEYQKSTSDPFILTKVGEHNWGTGGIAQATKLYVKSICLMTVLNNSVPPAPATPSPYDNSILAPPVTIAIGAVTAELDDIQMAAAIYRANDQE